MLDRLDELEDKHNESQVRYVPESQSASSSDEFEEIKEFKNEDLMRSSIKYNIEPSSVTRNRNDSSSSEHNTVLQLAQDEDQTDRYYDTDYASKISISTVQGDDVQYHHQTEYHSSRTEHHVNSAGTSETFFQAQIRQPAMDITHSSYRTHITTEPEKVCYIKI